MSADNAACVRAPCIILTAAAARPPACLQGIVKPALQRLRDGYSAKARELGDQLLSLQEQADSVRELLAEREEENRNAEGQVRVGRVVCGECGVGRREGLLGGQQEPPSRAAGVRRLRQDICVRDASA